MVEAKAGGLFRWNNCFDRAVCRISWVSGLDVGFVYETGPRKGESGYTTAPQDVTMLTVLDAIAEGLDVEECR
ncbi:MAG: hypothetical protein AB7L09_00385 [Nitrospira sp.]